MKLIYVTGGARSGKSTFAENYARSQAEKVLYIATATACDEEMAARIAKHREHRPSSWRTVEATKGLDKILAQTEETVVLLDCLTVWMNNLLFAAWHEEMTCQELDQLEKSLTAEATKLLEADYAGQLIVVSNELGMGVIPSTPLGRFFRDAAGRLNQAVATAADEAYLLVSGLPIRLK